MSLILVAEDNETNQKVLHRFIKYLGHECDMVSNGEEVLTAYLGNNYDLIFLDCELPIMEGYECAEKIRRIEVLNGFKTVPIIALTAHSEPKYKLKCFQAGMNDFLRKPVFVKDIQSVLMKWL